MSGEETIDRESHIYAKNIFRQRLSRHSSENDKATTTLLPVTAESFFQRDLEKYGWQGKLEMMLAGTRDKKSSLAALREHEATIVREIYSYLASEWARHVKLTVPAALVGVTDGSGMEDRLEDSNRMLTRKTSTRFEEGFVSFARCGRVSFPEPTGRNVNMMPFVFGSKDSLPEDLQCYHNLIEQCPYMTEDIGKVGYLTVHESYIEVGQTQRRSGLHIESPGVFSDATNATAAFTPGGTDFDWGMGWFLSPDVYKGGIFMASSVSNTSEVWDALVDNKVPNIVNKHGECEHLRGLLGKGSKLEAGELIWMTDITPHEALPQESSGYRQFFRVVTPCISHWYAEHSAENPKVPLPSNVIVVSESKF